MNNNNKNDALRLRNLGLSLRDISNILHRSTSTVRHWVSGVKLNSQQQANIAKRTLFKKNPYYKQLRKKMFDQIKRLAITNNGKCLSTKYINSVSPLKFICSNDHTWEATPDNIKRGTWCPYCSHNCINEEKCRHIFEQLTGKSFSRNYTILGNRQSLDGYCESLQLAFEFNGIQHYKYVWFFHKTQKKFRDQQRRDRIKLHLCQQLDIQLIVIPYNHADQLESFIKTELTNLEINIKKLENISFVGLRKKNNKLEECQSFARNKNWECLSEVFFTVGSSMIWECDSGHVWKSSWSNIKNGSGCPKCHKKKLRKLFAKYSIRDMRQIAQSRGGNCLSDKYVNCKTHLLWQCSERHTWRAVPEKIINGQWCRKCYIMGKRS